MTFDASSSKVEIVPAVLVENYDALEEALSRLVGVARAIQIDVCDGRFVPSTTFPYGGSRDTELWDAISGEREEQGFPYWKDFDFEADLMVKEPGKEAERWLRAGATRIIFHLGSSADIGGLIASMKGRVDVGLAVPADAAPSAWMPHLSAVDFMQVMGIKKVGFQGQPFAQEALATIAAIRAAAPSLPISVDGSVTDATARAIVEAGATRLVSGSFILSADEPALALQKLREAAEGGEDVQ